jgi:hypothetical protein
VAFSIIFKRAKMSPHYFSVMLLDIVIGNAELIWKARWPANLSHVPLPPYLVAGTGSRP